MEKLMTVQDVAPILNISVITVRRLVKRRELLHFRIGHKILFTEKIYMNTSRKLQFQ
jgi:excisionase family DNA binding protein